MLTLHHPELMHTVLNYPIGLYALTIKGNNRSALVVKANKEALLASQLIKASRCCCANGRRRKSYGWHNVGILRRLC